MREITDKKVIKTRPLTVSPIFGLPLNLDEGKYTTEANGEEVYFEYDEDGRPTGVPGDDPDAPGDTVVEERPPLVTPQEEAAAAPVEITVKSQTFRYAPDGTYVVDVVLEFPDVTGATKYEVRISA